jgi:DNA-binding CsgD family transcriptional regulator
MQIVVDDGRKTHLDADKTPVRLSRRDVQLALLVSRGRINKEIAFTLGITEGTVKIYMSHLFAKLGLSNRAELSAWAVRHDEEIARCLRTYDEPTRRAVAGTAVQTFPNRVVPRAANVSACSGNCQADDGSVGRIVVCFSCGSVLTPAHRRAEHMNESCSPACA